MPVEFLTDDQAEAYGTFGQEPTRPELERFSFLDDVDRELISRRRGDHNRLGFALQMCTVRYIGMFLEDPLEVPWVVVEHLAEQLGIEDVSAVKRYTEREKTPYEHGWEIRDAYGYCLYDEHETARQFRSFLHGRAWVNAEGPVALFNHAVAWLRRHRVLLPGVQRLVRDVATVREAAERRLHATVAKAAHRADAQLPGDLVALLEVPEGERFSRLEVMRRPPNRSTGTAMVKAMERVNEIAAFKLRKVRLDRVPPNRLASLARYGLGSKAPHLARVQDPKKTAMLTAVVRHLEAVAVDDALDLFSLLMSQRLFSVARRKSDKERLSMLPRLEKASRLVARAQKVLVEELERVEERGADLDVAALWRAVEQVGPRSYEALKRGRLAHVDQYYVRGDTISAANARLVAAQAQVPIVSNWGEGLVASVDGLRFVVPVRSINTGASPKYFGFKSGITWLNAVNDQVSGIGQMVWCRAPRATACSSWTRC